MLEVLQDLKSLVGGLKDQRDQLLDIFGEPEGLAGGLDD